LNAKFDAGYQELGKSFATIRVWKCARQLAVSW